MRTKNFTREEVLSKAMPLFWKRGYAETSIHDLEVVTGVNKSGLYSEFVDKEDIYIACLGYYLDEKARTNWLLNAPLGWDNIETFLKQAEHRTREGRGCLMVYAIRELPLLSKKAQKVVVTYNSRVRELLMQNVAVEKIKGNPRTVVDMILLLYSGIALGQNLRKQKHPFTPTVGDFMNLLKQQ